MRKFLSLTRVSLKSTMGMLSDGKSKSKSNIFLYIFLFICLLPTLGILYAMFHSAFEMMVALDQAGSVLALAFYLSSLITFVFSIFLIPSIFYFSKDSGTLLSLPIRPETILGSKFVVCLIYEYAFTLFILMPAFAAYCEVLSISFSFIVSSILVIFILPIFPLVLSSILSMLVMRFVPFFKNRDRFNLISGIVTILLAFGLSFSFNSVTLGSDPNALITTLLSGDNSLIELLGYFFPGVPFAARALVDGNMFSLVIFIVISLLSVILCMWIGKFIYFKGLIGFSETSSSRKSLSDQEVSKQSRKKNRVLTYTMKEIKLLIRTPIYAMNCIGSALIFPILFIAMPLMSGGELNTGDIPPEFITMLNSMWPYVIMIGIILGIFVSNLNLISCTAISREGPNISFMKYIPMPLSLQLHAKVLSGILISLLTDVLMLAALYFLFPMLPISVILIVFISSLAGIVLGNYLGIYIDIYHPKLVWEQEAAAVKQNMTSFIAMIGSWALAAILGILAFNIPIEYMNYVSIGILLLIIMLSVLLYKALHKVATKAFKNYY